MFWAIIGALVTTGHCLNVVKTWTCKWTLNCTHDVKTKKWTTCCKIVDLDGNRIERCFVADSLSTMLFRLRLRLRVRVSVRVDSIKFSPIKVFSNIVNNYITVRYMLDTCCTAGWEFVLCRVTGVFSHIIFRKILKRRISFCNKAWQKMRRVEKMKLYLCIQMLLKYASKLYVVLLTISLFLAYCIYLFECRSTRSTLTLNQGQLGS